MSTHGIVAFGTLRKWRGVYNHSDSYPTGLGKELHHYLLATLATGKTLEDIGQDILRFDDWRNYLKGGICEYCGKMTGQAHSISGAMAASRRKGYPDPRARHHSHNSLDRLDELQYTQRDVADSGIQWVYVLNAQAHCIHVLSVRETAPHVGDMLFSEAPNFTALECGDTLDRCRHYAWAHFPEIDQQGPQRHLGTRAYLGYEPLEKLDQAFAFEYRGRRYQRGGSGVNGRYAANFSIAVSDPNAWYEEVTAEDGQKFYMAVAALRDRDRTPYRGVTWIFPPTRVNPRETVRTS
jgi:hypothetical protein